MAIQFDSASLFTAAEREQFSSPEARVYRENLPGMVGEYAQSFGQGGRTIVATGILRKTGNTAALATAALKEQVRTNADYGVGGAPGTYTSIAAVGFGNCLMLSYERVGPIGHTLSGSTWTAEAMCRATFRQLDPGDIT